MKIIHIIPTYFPAVRYGGPIKSEHGLNKWLVKNGADVTVYATNIDGNGVLDVPLNKEVDIDGVKVFYFPITFRPWQYSYSLHCALAKNIKNFDLMRITSVFLAASTLGAYYAKKFKKPYYISPRGSLMIETLKKKSFKKNLYLKFIEKRNLKDAIIHFTADMEKDEYLKMGFPLKRGIIIPNGLDFDEFKNNVPIGEFRKKYDIKINKKIILFLGRLSWKKGFDTLIPAFAEVVKKESDAVLVIAGGDDENYKKTIDKLIKKYNIGDKIIFTGIIDGKDKVAAYQDSNIFVLPSYSENFGNAVFEAMYFGLPVVITKNVGGFPIVLEAGAGFIIEKNEKQLAEAILKILNNNDLAKKMGQNGKKLVETEFLWPKIAEEFMEEFDKYEIK